MVKRARVCEVVKILKHPLQQRSMERALAQRNCNSIFNDQQRFPQFPAQWTAVEG